MAKRVLVTGGAGFLGSHLCQALVADGASVIAVDNLLTGDLENLRPLSSDSRFTFENIDIVGPFDVGAVEFIFHFGSPASPPDYLKHGPATLRVGSVGTLNVLDLARRHGAGFLLASTSECYGEPEQHPQREEYWGNVNPIGVRSVYDESKRFSEAATMAYSRYYGLDTRIVRIFNTYGPRMRLDDGRVIPNFIGQALRGEALTVYGSGEQVRSFCYVADEIDGILRLAKREYREPVNIGNPTEFTILQCAQEVLAATGSKSALRYAPLPENDPTRRCPDISRARSLLGWEPRTDLRAGLKLTVAYFREQVRAKKPAPQALSTSEG